MGIKFVVLRQTVGAQRRMRQRRQGPRGSVVGAVELRGGTEPSEQPKGHVRWKTVLAAARWQEIFVPLNFLFVKYRY